MERNTNRSGMIQFSFFDDSFSFYDIPFVGVLDLKQTNLEPAVSNSHPISDSDIFIIL